MTRGAAHKGRIGLMGCRTSFPPTDSPSVHIYQVWHRLQRMGYEIHSYGRQAVPGCIEHPHTQDGFRDLLRSIDLLYFRFPVEYFITARSIARLLGNRRLPLVCEFNGPHYQFTRDMPWLRPYAIRYRARMLGRNQLVIRACVARGIATCEELAGYGRDYFGIPDVTVIPDGADPDQFHPGLRGEGRAAMGLADDEFVVLWAGVTKYRWQGLDQIVETARLVDDPKVRFILAGEREYLPDDLPANVTAAGRLPWAEMPRCVAAADVALCIYESYDWCPIGFWHSPLKLFEYLSSGVPVVASRLGQMCEVVQDGVNGYLTDGAPRDIAGRILELAADRPRAAEMGRGARQTILGGYTWQAAADATDVILQDVLAKSTRPRLRVRRPKATRRTVGLVSAHGGFGGTEEYLAKLMRGAAARGHDVVLFHPADSPAHWVWEARRCARTVCYDAPDAPAQADAGPEGAPHPGGLRQTLRALHRRLTPQPIRYLTGFIKEARRARRVFAAAPVDALHFSDLGVDPRVAAARAAGVPRLTGALNCLPRNGPLRDSRIYRFLESFCLRRLDGIAAVSVEGRRRWIRHAGIGEAGVRAVHNGTEVPSLAGMAEVRREVREELGLQDDARVVGVSAWLVPLKGHDVLLDAFAPVVQAVPEARLVLAGDGPCRAELEAQAGRLGIADRVLFLGHRTDIRRVVQACDVIALTSMSESLPFSLLEGMSYGMPAVGTAVGGVPELIEDGVSGYVVPPGDSQAVARALIGLLSDPENLARLGAAARERVVEHFNAETMVRQTLDMILDGLPPALAGPESEPACTVSSDT